MMKVRPSTFGSTHLLTTSRRPDIPGLPAEKKRVDGRLMSRSLARILYDFTAYIGQLFYLL